MEVRLGHAVDQIDADGVIVAGERIFSKTVIWTAGVAPSPAGKWLGAATDRSGRVRIQSDLSVPGHPEIFVIGDTASLDQDGRPLPGVAQVAIQQGRYAGKLIRRENRWPTRPRAFPIFRQRQHGGGRKRVRGRAKRKVANVRAPRLACLGRNSSALSRPIEPSRKRVRSMGLDLSHRPARVAAHCEPPR